MESFTCILQPKLHGKIASFEKAPEKYFTKIYARKSNYVKILFIESYIVFLLLHSFKEYV
jgi:hypothetical protein